MNVLSEPKCSIGQNLAKDQIPRDTELENEENIALKTTRDSDMTTGAEQREGCRSKGRERAKCGERLDCGYCFGPRAAACL